MDKGLYNTQTTYRYYQSLAQSAGEYAIGEWTLTDPTYG